MPAAAQGFTIAGTVTHGGGPTRQPLAGRWAVLHQITAQGGAPLDSTRTDAAGRYRFRLPTVDTAAVYLVSTDWHGIGYFSAPARLLGRPVDTLETLVVYDTSSVGAPIRLIRRLITIARSEATDGTFDVLEAWSIENPGPTARVSDDTARPVWTVSLPPTALQFQARESDVSPEAVVRRGDGVAVYGTIAPGGVRQVTATYALPADTRELELAIDQWTQQLDLLIEGEDVTAVGGDLASLGSTRVEGRTFQRFVGGPLEAGTTVGVTLPRAPLGTQAVLPVVVGVLILALAGGMWMALRPRRAASSPG